MMGEFLPFLFLVSLLFTHELGHFLAAGLLGCFLDKICFYPFGGISKFQMDLNKPIKEEVIILIMGPLFQTGMYLFLSQFPFTEMHLSLLKNLHVSLLLFNLLPIYPLDGGRLLLLFLQIFLPFYTGFQIIFSFSFLLIFLFFYGFLVTKELNFLFVFFLLFVTLRREIQTFPFYFDKFLLERFLDKYYFSKTKIVTSFKQFRRNRMHIIKENGKYYKEREYLKKKFTKSS